MVEMFGIDSTEYLVETIDTTITNKLEWIGILENAAVTKPQDWADTDKMRMSRVWSDLGMDFDNK